MAVAAVGVGGESHPPRVNAARQSPARAAPGSAAAGEVADVHGLHAGIADGLHPQVGVFVGAAVFGAYANSPGGFQENVSRGISA